MYVSAEPVLHVRHRSRNSESPSAPPAPLGPPPIPFGGVLGEDDLPCRPAHQLLGPVTQRLGQPGIDEGRAWSASTAQMPSLAVSTIRRYRSSPPRAAVVIRSRSRSSAPLPRPGPSDRPAFLIGLRKLNRPARRRIPMSSRATLGHHGAFVRRIDRDPRPETTPGGPLILSMRIFSCSAIPFT